MNRNRILKFIKIDAYSFLQVLGFIFTLICLCIILGIAHLFINSLDTVIEAVRFIYLQIAGIFVKMGLIELEVGRKKQT